MGPRMLCTECFETSRPSTLLPGSDRVELGAWLCLALPGWLYCAWRHALREKACGVCGGSALVREARAAAARAPDPEPPGTPPRSRLRRGSLRWPAALATPRDRLRAGGPAALATGAALLAGVLIAAGPGPCFAAVAIVSASAVNLARALAGKLRAWRRSRARLAGCRAWRPDGREIRVEPV